MKMIASENLDRVSGVARKDRIHGPMPRWTADRHAKVQAAWALKRKQSTSNQNELEL